MNNKRIALFALVTSLTCLVTATEYYVDAINGNDDWDGSTNFAARNEAALIGPKKTFHGTQGVMTLSLQPYDLIHAAPGIYNEGSKSRSNLANRLLITTANLGVVADEGPDVTFIEGAASAENANGCGTDAVRGVWITGTGSYVRGFTIRNGRTLNTDVGSDKDWNCGGCIFGGIAIDCVITGGGCSQRGRGARGVTAIGCRFTGNNGGGSYSAYKGTYFSCLFNESSDYPYSCSSYNSTFKGTKGPRGGVHVNSYVESTNKGTPTLTNCVLKAASFDGVTAVDCQLTTGNELDSTDTPRVTSKLIDAGRTDYYVAALRNALGTSPAAEFVLRDYLSTNPRCTGAAIDIGAIEYNWHRAYAVALSESAFFSVTNDSAGITVLEDGVQLTSGASLSAVWACPSANVNEDSFTYTVTVTGTGVLNVYLDGAQTSTWILQSTGSEQTITYTAHNHSLRFEVVGEATTATLAAFTTTGGNVWHVDAVAGNDEWDGSRKVYEPGTTKGPKKTLQGAMTIVGLAQGDVVYAAPGVYNEGGVATGGGFSNRVTVAAGVGLVATAGPEATIIEGAISDDPSAVNGCGPGAVRCAHVGTGGYVRGFTLRNGRTAKGSANDYNGGGAYLWGALIDCVVTNCWSGYRGAVYGRGNSAVIRCRILKSASSDLECAVNGSTLVSTVVDGGQVYSGGILLNCAVWGYNIRSSSASLTLYNTLCNKNISGNGTCYRSFIGGTADKNSGVGLNDQSRLGIGETAMSAWYDSGRLLSGTLPVDFGNADYYRDYFPQTWKRFMDKDVLGEQRIYNNAIDVGPAEYDWRADFAAQLGKAYQIRTVSPEVHRLNNGGLRMPSGEVVFVAQKEGAPYLRCTVVNGGRLLVYGAEDVPVELVAGSHDVRFANLAAGDELRIVYEPAAGGSAELHALTTYKGLVLNIR